MRFVIIRLREKHSFSFCILLCVGINYVLNKYEHNFLSCVNGY
jgi:hypothetical protein